MLLTVGKPKAAYLAQGLEDYAGRLMAYGGCSLQAVRPLKAFKNTPAAQVLLEEGRRLLERLEPRDQVWVLDVAGRAWSSEEWARRLRRTLDQGCRRLVLVVGGPEGLDQAVLARADQRVSLGPATLPHELAACVALEQLYRAHTILAGTPYHRG